MLILFHLTSTANFLSRRRREKENKKNQLRLLVYSPLATWNKDGSNRKKCNWNSMILPTFEYPSALKPRVGPLYHAKQGPECGDFSLLHCCGTISSSSCHPSAAVLWLRRCQIGHSRMVVALCRCGLVFPLCSARDLPGVGQARNNNRPRMETKFLLGNFPVGRCLGWYLPQTSITSRTLAVNSCFSGNDIGGM